MSVGKNCCCDLGDDPRMSSHAGYCVEIQDLRAQLANAFKLEQNWRHNTECEQPEQALEVMNNLENRLLIASNALIKIKTDTIPLFAALRELNRVESIAHPSSIATRHAIVEVMNAFNAMETEKENSK
jgi:hypothetical protein